MNNEMSRRTRVPWRRIWIDPLSIALVAWGIYLSVGAARTFVRRSLGFDPLLVLAAGLFAWGPLLMLVFVRKASLARRREKQRPV
jgi:hypothetical protein